MSSCVFFEEGQRNLVIPLPLRDSKWNEVASSVWLQAAETQSKTGQAQNQTRGIY